MNNAVLFRVGLIFTFFAMTITENGMLDSIPCTVPGTYGRTRNNVKSSNVCVLANITTTATVHTVVDKQLYCVVQYSFRFPIYLNGITEKSRLYRFVYHHISSITTGDTKDDCYVPYVRSYHHQQRTSSHNTTTKTTTTAP